MSQRLSVCLSVNPSGTNLFESSFLTDLSKVSDKPSYLVVQTEPNITSSCLLEALDRSNWTHNVILFLCHFEARHAIYLDAFRMYDL